MSRWIWKFGEFEIYHSLLVHCRRQEYGFMEPAVWKVYAPDPVVCFQKTVTTQGGIFRVKARGDYSVRILRDGQKLQYWGKEEIMLGPGTATVAIRVSNRESFPSLYVDGVIESDESWLADDLTEDRQPVGFNDLFVDPDQFPDVFPFSYTPISYCRKEPADGGILFEFDKETFARTRISNLGSEMTRVQFGESREEALDPVYSVVHFTEHPTEGQLSYPAYAFRYLFVSNPDAEVSAEYEYFPLEYKGAFWSGEEIVDRVWDIAAYTFHLNCREFFLDGIKRDRWVWSADAYQSLFVNRYLFLDKDMEQRTLIALGGKLPFKQHINTIMDYTFFWIISIYENYRTYGDIRFLRQILPQLQAVAAFCAERRDADGFMREKPGDWIFIDWADMDREGALCGEQILYAKALECYSHICRVLEIDDRGSHEQAQNLQEQIQKYFYDAEKKVFIDSFESGRRNVTRHSNILAYLFLPCSLEQKKSIYENVVLNDAVPQITTPYFKFYENQVHCEEKNGILLERSIREYYGSMLKLGATTLFEAYDPTQKGTEHFHMYDYPYDKSLCHAWSASPIYLLGCYRLGVRNTGIAYDSYIVEPDLGDLTEFEGSVPVPDGSVRVKVTQDRVSVLSDIEGGTLLMDGQSYPIRAGKELSINRKKILA